MLAFLRRFTLRLGNDQDDEKPEEDAPEGPPAPVLDRTKPFSTIRGPVPERYQQGGHFFSGTGEFLYSDERAEAEPAPAPAPDKKAEKKVDNSAKAQQGEINLQEWFTGKTQYAWLKVQVAVEKAVGERQKSKAEAFELLQKHGVVNNDNLDDTNG